MNPRARVPHALPKHATAFVDRAIRIVERHIPSAAYALFLFGSLSHARDGADCVDGTSDVDLLFIVKDGCDEAVRDAWPELNALQQHYFDDVGTRRGIVPAILRAVERQTGMHESIFLTRERDFKEARFSRIFTTNKILSRLLAPTSIVFGSALCHMKRIHGDAAFDGAVRSVKAAVGVGKSLLPDLARSMLMNAALVMGAVVLLPLTKRATRYAVEATKWSMYAVTYSMTGERPSKPCQLRFFSGLGVSPAFLGRWLELGRRYAPDVKFSLAALWNVVRIHALGFKMRGTRRW
ncbi:MAG: nucleotidyltransferase domain-containing protein [Candidatus Lokiarchaeota archaeon]|nr:nucleotidyltransferase domain-containing protein [Candidatus Lokiarchaeota archaeon]